MQSIDDIKLRIEVFEENMEQCRKMSKQHEYDGNAALADAMIKLAEDYRIRADTLRWVLNASKAEISAP